MKQLGRWRMTDEALSPIGARSGAFLTNPIDARARAFAAERRVVAPAATQRPARPARHIHVHLPASVKVRDRARTHDATVPAGGFPISAGDTFSVSDCGDDGFSLRRVRTGDTNPDGMPTPGDNVFGQTDPPGAANLDALRRRIATRQVNDRSAPDGGMSQLRDMQVSSNRCNEYIITFRYIL